MKISDLRELIKSRGKITVKFIDGCQDWESCIDPGMIADVIKVGAPDFNEVVKIYFDLNPYDNINDSYMVRNYYDKNGVPILTAKESGLWPEDGVERVYVMETDDLSSVLTVEPENVILKEYIESGSRLSYIKWLEDKLVKLQ
jgi:hypothetical protein